MNEAVKLDDDLSAAQHPHTPPPTFDYEVWLEAILGVARHYRLECSAQSVRLAAQWTDSASVEDVVRRMARQAGLNCVIGDFCASTLMQRQLPLVVQFADGQVGVLELIGEDDSIGIAYSGDGGLQSRLGRRELLEQARKTVILRPMRAVRDTRIDDYIKPYQKNWFSAIVLRDLRPYGYVMLASLVTSVLGLAGVLFSMQVYDRVIPAESMPTLYVLFGGVMLALVFDFIMRITRVRITDMLGKRADLRVSDLVFGHAIRLRNSARPKSTGSFISQLKELEQLRELITSSTATALADLPFFLLFLVIYWLIAGPLVAVPLVAVLFLVVPGLLAQKNSRPWPASRCAKAHCAARCWWKPYKASTTSRLCKPSSAFRSSGTITTPPVAMPVCACACSPINWWRGATTSRARCLPWSWCSGRQWSWPAI